MDTVNLPDDTQAEIMRIVATELDEIRTHAVDPVDALTHATHAYLLLRAHLWHSMGDISVWTPHQEGAYPFATWTEARRLTAYIDHLAAGGHGECARCGRWISAHRRYVELPGRPLWHPALWGYALRDAWRALRYGPRTRYAHTPRCATR